MTESNVFSFERFLSLAGSDLVRYTEPFVNSEMQRIPEHVYEPLQSALEVMDEVHIVYALEICMLLKPSEFVSRVITFLSHTDAAVCCTACRLIERVPPSLMPLDLVKKIGATPTVDLFAPDLHSGNRICIGTNEEFVHSLVTTFGGVS